jgi:hypothetical protein
MTHCWFDSPCSGTGSSCASTCGRISGFLIAALLLVSAPANADDHPGAGDSWLARYQGRPFSDGTIVGPAVIPGQVKCAYYDLGGEGIAYHDADGVNHGSGMLNPVNGDPLHEFRMHEGVDISYTKSGGIDDNPFDRYQPPMRSLYVGWTEPGEWINVTVDVRQAGAYTVDIPYTANGEGRISLALDGAQPLAIIRMPSTNDRAEPVAWRQWHHWAFLADAAAMSLPAGRHVLTLKIEANGNMNLDSIVFRPASEATPAVAPPPKTAAAWTPADAARRAAGPGRLDARPEGGFLGRLDGALVGGSIQRPGSHRPARVGRSRSPYRHGGRGGCLEGVVSGVQ